MMETDSLLMDDQPTSSTVSHRRLPGGILSPNIIRRTVHDSSDEELLDVNLPSPDVIQTQTDDRPSHGMDIKSSILYYQFVHKKASASTFACFSSKFVSVSVKILGIICWKFHRLLEKLLYRINFSVEQHVNISNNFEHLLLCLLL